MPEEPPPPPLKKSRRGLGPHKNFEENQLGYDFDDFLNIYNAKIDNFFKLEKPKLSKRNWQVNPWITDGLITSINKKKETYTILGKAQPPKNIQMVTHMHIKRTAATGKH